MKHIIQVGSTNVNICVFVQDATSTNGAGLNSVNLATATTSWYWTYFRSPDTSHTNVTIVPQTLGTWTSGGVAQVASLSEAGMYQLGVPNAVFSTGSWAVMYLIGTSFNSGGTATASITQMVPCLIEFELVPWNPQDGSALGLTVLTSGTVTATVPGAGGTNVNVVQWNGASVATPNVAGVPKVDVVDWLGTAVTSSGGTPVVVATNTQPVNVVQWLGTAVTSSGGVPVTTNLGTVTATVPTAVSVTGTVTATVPTAVTVTGTVTATVPTEVSANVTQWLGTAVTSNAGVPIVDVAAGTITTVTGNVQGTVAAVTTCTGVGTASNILGTLPANVVQWLGTAVTSNAGVPLVDVNGITGTVTATVVGGTIATVTNPVSIGTGQLTVKRNVALNGFTFPMYNSTTGNPATGLSVSCTRSIDGGSLGASANSPSEVGSGIYSINLAASDLNGGVITLVFVASAASATIITLITQT